MSVPLIESAANIASTASSHAHTAYLRLAAGMPWDGVAPTANIPGAQSVQGLLGGVEFYVGVILSIGFLAGIVFLLLSNRSSHMKSSHEGHRWLTGAIVGSGLGGSMGIWLGWAWQFGSGLSH